MVYFSLGRQQPGVLVTLSLIAFDQFELLEALNRSAVPVDIYLIVENQSLDLG